MKPITNFKDEMSKNLTTDQFIEKAIQLHGGKYDYSLVEYVNNQTKVKIICHEHGVFEQQPSGHLRPWGCKQCGIIKAHSPFKYTTDQFIEKARQKHGDKYDYSLVEYTGAYNKVKIICHEHGEFEQRPYKHIEGSNCMQCYRAESNGRYFYDPMSPVYTPDRISYVYLFKLNNDNEEFNKIGISVDLQQRMNQIEKVTNYHVTLLDSIETTVKDALEIESDLHSQYNECKYQPLIHFNGHTECFTGLKTLVNVVSE